MLRLVIILCISILPCLNSQLLANIASNNEQKCVLVVGGAGFIGAHVNKLLGQQGYQTIVLDNLSKGYQQNVLSGIFVQGDMADSALLDHLFTTYPIEAVIHFAAYTEVGESVENPLKYYRNNVINTLNLLEAMQRHGVNIFIFSSSAAVYGTPLQDYVTETHPCNPINPYGQSKLIVEHILPDLDRAYHLRYCCLRYFNVAGNDPEGHLKNYKSKEANLIPIVLRSIQSNRPITIFGTDYSTPDGTCIRDYIHVEDLANAHIAALKKLLNGAPSCCYNLGNGRGYSVRQVLDAAEKVTKNSITVVEGPRRPGDPAVIMADSSKAWVELDWKPQYNSIEEMVEHAWNGMQAP